MTTRANLTRSSTLFVSHLAAIGGFVSGSACGAVSAVERAPSADSPAQMSVRVDAGEAPWISVEARAVALSALLDELAKRAGAPIHYSVLPDEKVSATCAGKTIESVLQCLLGKDIGVVTRAAGKTASPEVWIQGSSFVASRAQGAPQKECSADASGATRESKKAKQAKTASSAETERLVQAATQSADPGVRAQALSDMVQSAPRDDPAVKAAFEAGLTDKDVNVRAQAVYGTAYREGPQAEAVLQDALRDSDASVRLMAVDGAWNDDHGTALLREALQDSDETVREFAAARLEERGVKPDMP